MGIDETNKKIYFANAGDSRVVLCRKGVAEEGSKDHKPEMESEKNRIYKADGWISEGRVKGNLNLTRGFGDLEYKQNKNLKISLYLDAMVFGIAFQIKKLAISFLKDLKILLILNCQKS